MSKRLVRDVVAYLAVNLANAAIPYLLLPLLTRVLPPVELGVVAMFQAIVSFLGGLVGLNIHGAVAVEHVKLKSSEFGGFVAMALVILASSFALVVSCVIFCAGPFSTWTGLAPRFLVIAVIVSAAQFVVNVRLVIWQMKHSPLNYGVFQVGLTFLNMGLSVFGVVYLDQGATGRIAGIAYATVVFALIALYSMQRAKQLQWRWNGEYVRRALQFGLPLVPHTIGGVIVALSDRFIVTSQLTLESTGRYFVAAQLSLPLLILGDSLNRAFAPWLYAELAAGNKHRAVLASYCMSMVIILIAIVYAVAINIAFPYMVGEKYVSVLNLTTILIGGTTCQAIYYAFVNYIFYAGKTGYLSGVTITSGIIYVTGAWYICRYQGLAGLAWWFAGIQAMILGLTILVSALKYPMPWLAGRELVRTLKTMLFRTRGMGTAAIT